eukprot:g27786.t1
MRPERSHSVSCRIAWCKICRERIGARTGGPEGFKCKECEGFGQGPNSNFWEGILRGDRGPKYVPELTSWQYFWRAVELCKPFRVVLQCAVACTCITQLGRILLPNYQGKIINSLIAGDKSAAITCDVRTVMFESLVKQDIAFFDGTMTGQLTSRMTNDVAAVVQPVRQIMPLGPVGGLFMCLFTSWKLTVLAATMIGPVVYLTGVYARWSKQVNMSIRVSMADANAVSTEALRNIRTVRSFGADLLDAETGGGRGKAGKGLGFERL